VVVLAGVSLRTVVVQEESNPAMKTKRTAQIRVRFIPDEGLRQAIELQAHKFHCSVVKLAPSGQSG